MAGRRPKDFVIVNGKLKRNKLANAGADLRKYGNPEIVPFALEAITADIESGVPMAGRYSRVRDAIIAKFHCAKDTAQDAIKGARAYNADMFATIRPIRVAELSQQLQRIADMHERDDPQAAIAALVQIGKLTEAYPTTKISVEHNAAPVLQLRSVIDALDEDGRAALEIVLLQIETAKAGGRLELPPAEYEDAEIVSETPN